MPATADLVGLREAFSCEADYLLFVERHVCTCLSGKQYSINFTRPFSCPVVLSFLHSIGDSE